MHHTIAFLLGQKSATLKRMINTQMGQVKCCGMASRIKKTIARTNGNLGKNKQRWTGSQPNVEQIVETCVEKLLRKASILSVFVAPEKIKKHNLEK